MKPVHAFFFLLLLLCVAAHNPKKKGAHYSGGRPGYSFADLYLFPDSTCDFYVWYHTGLRQYHPGRWKKSVTNFVLNSTNKRGKTPRNPRFVNQEFSISGDTLQFIAKNPADKDYYDAYSRFVKAKDER